MQDEPSLINNISSRDIDYIVAESGAKLSAVLNLIDLFDASMTVPFISRYRKEMIHSADETVVQKVKELCDYIAELNSRKKTIVATISEQGSLTEELKTNIENTYIKSELEDIYLPYRPKRKTKASVAKAKGLLGLAEEIIDFE
ncbi:RNA-binding transcriptional accessory protein, partial [candidate division WOR-3 bacterium]|nr:RNA-binding transcriptional accessory protein [candidate division WOR-3 bacterium]